MKKRILFVCSVCCCMAFSAYSQDRATIHQAPSVVLEDAKLHALSDNINAKETALAQMTASSRGIVAEAQAELNTLLADYKVQLTTELEAAHTDAQLNQLKEEILYVESKQTVKTTR